MLLLLVGSRPALAEQPQPQPSTALQEDQTAEAPDERSARREREDAEALAAGRALIADLSRAA
ncbi:MAG TPA: hypothetical protein VFZ61_00830, partial [Polyangiales bacterium]